MLLVLHAEQRSWSSCGGGNPHWCVCCPEPVWYMQDAPRKVQLPHLGGGFMQDGRRVLDALCTEAGWAGGSGSPWLYLYIGTNHCQLHCDHHPTCFVGCVSFLFLRVLSNSTPSTCPLTPHHSQWKTVCGIPLLKAVLQFIPSGPLGQKKKNQSLSYILKMRLFSFLHLNRDIDQLMCSLSWVDLL